MFSQLFPVVVAAQGASYLLSISFTRYLTHIGADQPALDATSKSIFMP